MLVIPVWEKQRQETPIDFLDSLPSLISELQVLVRDPVSKEIMFLRIIPNVTLRPLHTHTLTYTHVRTHIHTHSKKKITQFSKASTFITKLALFYVLPNLPLRSGLAEGSRFSRSLLPLIPCLIRSRSLWETLCADSETEKGK